MTSRSSKAAQRLALDAQATALLERLGELGVFSVEDLETKWSSEWRDNVTHAGLTRDEAIEWATRSIKQASEALQKRGQVEYDRDSWREVAKALAASINRG